MMARNRINRKPAPPLFPREPIPDGELRGADGRRLHREGVVRMPEQFSRQMRATTPERAGRIVEIYRRNGQELVDARMDGVDHACGLATWEAAKVRRSQARIRTAVQSMPAKKKEVE